MLKAPPPQLVDRIGLEKLAALPQATTRLLKACHDRESGLDRLADIIRTDAGLTSKMLNVARSPLYLQWGDIGDLNRMTVVLGLNTIKSIAITSSVLELFSKVQPRRKSMVAGFWYRSLHCALVAERLAGLSRQASRDDAYLAGLLHKIGQLVLMNSDLDGYAELLHGHSDPRRLDEEERRLFGISHAELGAWLIDRWGLGDLITDAALYQSEPTNRVLDTPPLVRLINLAARLTDPTQRDGATQDIAKLVPVGADDLETLMGEAATQVEVVARSYGVAIAPPADEPAAATPRDPFPEDRAELAGLVLDAALIESAKAAMWEQSQERDPLAAARTFFALLFGLENTLFFLKEPGNSLRGHPLGDGDRSVGHFTVALLPGRSVLSDALLRRKALDSFQYQSVKTTLNVVDRQLIRICGRSGVLAIPLIAGDRPLGVVLAGIEPSTIGLLDPYQDLLKRFAAEAANLLLRHRESQDQRLLLASESRAEVMQQVRRVRHEANNPLGIVSNYLHILDKRIAEGAPVRNELDIIRGEIGRVGDILRGLTDSHPGETSPDGSVDLNRLISGLLSVLKPSLFDQSDIEVEPELDSGLPLVKADPNRVKQILVNLLKNAAEAMPEGGRVRIATRADVIAEDGRRIEVSIGDTGPGLPESVRKHLFQPVVSTKEGQHRGLGLAISAQLAREQGALLRCRTGFDGTVFYLSFPRTSDT